MTDTTTTAACCICGRASRDLVRYRHAELRGGPKQWRCPDTAEPACQLPDGLDASGPLGTLAMFPEPAAPGDVLTAWQDYLDARSPEDVCRDEVIAAIWRAADLACDTPPPGSDEWLERRADERAMHDLHLATIRFAHAAGVELRGWISNARKIARPVTWAEVGEILGVTRQSAQERYATKERTS